MTVYAAIMLRANVYIYLPTARAVVMNRLSLEKYEVLWMSNDVIYKQKKEIASQLLSMVGEKLGKGLAYGATRLAPCSPPSVHEFPNDFRAGFRPTTLCMCM